MWGGDVGEGNDPFDPPGYVYVVVVYNLLPRPWSQPGIKFFVSAQSKKYL